MINNAPQKFLIFSEHNNNTIPYVHFHTELQLTQRKVASWSMLLYLERTQVVGEYLKVN